MVGDAEGRAVTDAASCAESEMAMTSTPPRAGIEPLLNFVLSCCAAGSGKVADKITLPGNNEIVTLDESVLKSDPMSAAIESSRCSS